MCGIGGFSLSADSKIHPRVLANALLTALEDRGYMASGVAWQARDGSQGVYKDAVAGSGLKLKAMPKDAYTVICHTRLATHGSIHDNRNNHPVLSPERSIALVHNGVIYNHSYVRQALPKIPFEVDTAVIPALIEDDPSLERLRELDGDAAISWLSDSNPGVLNVARLEHSPLVIAQLDDGSFVFASTEALLWRVLVQLDIMPEFIKTVPEYTLLRVKDGVINEWSSLGRSTAVGYGYDYGHYRHLTSGAKGGSVSSIFGYEDDPYWREPDYASKYGVMGYGDGVDYFDDDDDEDDEAEELRLWNDSFQMSTPVVKVEDSPAEYYIQYKSAIHKTPHYMWYHSDEAGEWRQDIFLIGDAQGDYDLLDYGRVAKSGILESQMAGSSNVSCTLDTIDDDWD